MRFLIIVFLFISYFASAQQLMTVEDAVNIALKSNFDILVARNNADIDKVNNTRGNAGMLPVVDLNGSANFQANNTNQEYSDGTSTSYNPLTSTNVGAGPQLSWLLYDGGKMFVTKNKLNEIEALGEIQFKEKVLEVVYNVIAAYYNVVRQNQQLASIKEVLDLNQERVTIAQAGFNAGSLLKTDLLQAKIDMNVTMENAINQQFAIDAAKKDLNVLLGKAPENDFMVSDSIPFQYTPDKEKLFQQIDTANTSILAFQKQLDISRLNVTENKKNYYPTLSLKGGYNFSQTMNSDGSLIKSRLVGPQIGGTLAIPLYNSGETKRKIAEATIQMQSAQYDLDYVKLQVASELQNAITNFENQRKLMLIEKENNALTKENFEISLSRLKLGQTTSLEVHQAQENYVQSSTRLINFEYNLKINEIKLKQLISSL